MITEKNERERERKKKKKKLIKKFHHKMRGWEEEE